MWYDDQKGKGEHDLLWGEKTLQLKLASRSERGVVGKGLSSDTNSIKSNDKYYRQQGAKPIYRRQN